MPTATLTSKGQITVPKEVRAALGVQAGDRLAFRVLVDGSVLVEPEAVDPMSLFGLLGRARKSATVEDMNAAIRRRAAGRR